MELCPQHPPDAISVRQAKGLLTASFRFPVAGDTLAVRLCASHHRARSGLSPVRFRPYRAHTQECSLHEDSFTVSLSLIEGAYHFWEGGAFFMNASSHVNWPSSTAPCAERNHVPQLLRIVKRGAFARGMPLLSIRNAFRYKASARRMEIDLVNSSAFGNSTFSNFKSNIFQFPS